jgi:hypothetical protein
LIYSKILDEIKTEMFSGIQAEVTKHENYEALEFDAGRI